MNARRYGLLLVGLTLSIRIAAFAEDPLVPLRDDQVAKGSATQTDLLTPPSLPVVGGAWVEQGPSPIFNAQTEGITNSPVTGAVQAIAPHPSNADILWVGTVNGGVWKTTNATNASPTWTAMGDAFTSLSIGALNLDPTDATNNTLVAAFGRYSSFGGVGGPRNGLLRTTNGGTNWTALTPATLTGKNMSGVAARGAVIVVSVNIADSFTCGNIGIFRSIDSGASFSIISATGGSLPLGRAFDLAGDPTNSAILYTAIRDTSVCGGGTNGVYKSTDTGATWAKVSNPAMDALLADGASPANVRIAVGLSGQVYAGIIDGSGHLAGLFRSSTGGPTWTQLDTPTTNEGGSIIGIQPEESGGQGSTHFSIVADPTDANIVYVGGDRQPLTGDGLAGFPNSLGAFNYTGRLFRVNATAGAGTQATSLTHCNTASAACNSTISTNNLSAPHADSRRLAFDANGNILESDDGGIYRRTNPRTTGDWFSVIGSLRVNEMHDVAYDRVSNIVFSGNQDTGSAEQTSVGGTTWNEISQGDGGDVAVDDFTSGTQSTRFSSAQNLGGLQRRVMNTSGSATSSVFPARTVTSGPAFSPQFDTPVEVNVIDGTRMLFGGSNDLYESLDRGDTIAALTLNRTSTAMVYGGKSGGIDNVNLIYVISTSGPSVGGPNVFVRTSGAGAPVITTTQPGSSALRDITVDPSDWHIAYVANSAGEVYTTPNNGGSWTNITGNLTSGTTDLRSIVFVPGTPSAVLVGGRNGVFRMTTDNPGVWNQFGSGLSNAPVFDLDYDAIDDTLVAGTMGRGAWKLNPVGNLGPLPALSINDVVVTEGNAGTVNANFTVTLSVASGVPVSVNYATADGTAATGTATFTNAAAISIPSVGNATPYPSNLAVAGTTGTITKVTATLTNFSHTFPSDVDVLLVGPGGQSVVLMSDPGGDPDASGLNLTFDDAAGSSLPSGTALASGTYLPTNLADGLGSDTYSAPAPPSGYGSTMSVFNGTSPNGTWSLYVVDDAGGDSGSIAGGFTLNFTTTGGDYIATSGLLTFSPGVVTQPVSISVNGDVTVEPNETFFVNLTSPANANIADAQGQGTITDDDGSLAAPTNVVATATGTTSVNITWTASPGAASYRVYRNSGGGYGLVGSPAASPFSDNTAVANTAYLYKVHAFAGSESGDSNIDLATTVVFTDPTLTGGTTLVKLAHFNELLTAVNAVCTLAVQPTIAFTAPTPTTSVTIRAQHLVDLRTALDAARNTLTLSALSYTDPTVTAGTTIIKTAHITDLRNGTQ